MSRETDGFLGRWSARKQAARESVAEEPVVEAEAPVQPDPDKTDAEILEELGLKDPDEMGEGDDFSGFMSGAIPERLRNRALRKLWLTNPVLANLDELVDYGEDFTDAATVVENLQTAYRVGKGFLRQEEIDAAEAAEASEADDSDEVAEVEPEAAEPDSEDTEIAFSSDGTVAEDSAVADVPEPDHADPDLDVVNEPTKPPQEPQFARPRRMVFRSA